MKKSILLIFSISTSAFLAVNSMTAVLAAEDVSLRASAPVVNQDARKTLSVGPAHLNTLSTVTPVAPLRLEADYNQKINLESCLRYAIQNSLPIKVANESAVYQRWQLAGDIALALPLPGIGMSYGQVFSNVLTAQTHALATNYQPTINLNLFQGGSQVNGMMAQYYRYKGWQNGFYVSINDALLDVYLKYNNLLLQRTLLQIRAKNLETSERVVAQTERLVANGTGNQIAVAQSRIRLDSDQQALLDQQLNLRLASLALSYAINAPLAVNLLPQESAISEDSLFDESLPVGRLWEVALTRSPELRTAENYRLSARRNVALAASALYPQLSVDGQYTFTETNTSLTPAGRLNPNPGDPSGAGVFPGIFDTLQTSYQITWNFTNLAIPSITNVFATRVLAKQAELQGNREWQDLDWELRTSYLNSIAARAQIDDLADSVAAAGETLRLAQERIRNGTTSNSELVLAQTNYSDLLARQAQCIFTSNVSQARVLHDSGIISMKTLLHGYKLGDVLPKHSRLE